MYPLPPGSMEPPNTGATYQSYWSYKSRTIYAYLAVVVFIAASVDASLPFWAYIACIAGFCITAVLWMFWFAKYVADWDEYQRSILLQAGVGALAITIVVLTVNALLSAHTIPNIAPKYLPFIPLGAAVILHPLLRWFNR